MYTADVIADSLNDVTGNRITTFRVVMPRVVLAEIVTHRIMFIDDTHDAALVREAYDLDIPHPTSRNTASSRAVPINRMLEKVTKDPFIPIFRTAQKGMTSGVPVDDDAQRDSEADWAMMMDACRKGVQRLSDRGIEKGQANRPLEWFSWIEMLITGTEWNNFFLLRDHPAAQGEMRETAQTMKEALNGSIPNILQPGEWHLPYIEPISALVFDGLRNARRSAARCARVSYRSLVTGKPSTLEEDVALYERLCGGNPKHLSPTEHQAVALPEATRAGNLVGWNSLRKVEFALEESGGDYKT